MVNINYLPKYNAAQKLVADITGTTLAVPYGEGGEHQKYALNLEPDRFTANCETGTVAVLFTNDVPEGFTDEYKVTNIRITNESECCDVGDYWYDIATTGIDDYITGCMPDADGTTVEYFLWDVDEEYPLITEELKQELASQTPANHYLFSVSDFPTIEINADCTSDNRDDDNNEEL